MDQFTINVKVEVDLSTATAELLRSLFNTQVAQPTAPARKPRKKAEEAPEEAAPAPQETEAPEAPAPKEEQPIIPSEEDVRQAMYKTRARIEGEDWKEKSSEGYKKHHKALTELFIKMATALGSERPSALAMDKRKEFIDGCECIKVGDDGIVFDDLPF